MRTRKEIIEELERAISMAENEYKTIVDYNLDPDCFYPWMVGWMIQTIKHAKTDLELL